MVWKPRHFIITFSLFALLFPAAAFANSSRSRSGAVTRADKAHHHQGKQRHRQMKKYKRHKRARRYEARWYGQRSRVNERGARTRRAHRDRIFWGVRPKHQVIKRRRGKRVLRPVRLSPVAKRNPFAKKRVVVKKKFVVKRRPAGTPERRRVPARRRR